MNICPLTGELLFKEPSTQADSLYYELNLHGRLLRITLCHKCYLKILKEIESNKFEKHQPVIKSLLVNGKFGSIDSCKIHWDSDEVMNAQDKLQPFDLKKELEQAVYPKSPREKFDNLFLELYKLQKIEGENVTLPDLTKQKLYELWYFQDYAPFLCYLKVLEEQGLIEINHKQSLQAPVFKFTYKGLIYYMNQFEEGYNSKTCFIAMAFQPGMEAVRQAIKNAVRSSGFLPFIVDEEHLNSDTTINDAIIAGLKKCKFCVSDFSHHKNGVYFEAGFAVGQGKPVIYTCSEEEFKNAHFDIKPLQHIIYKDAAQLERELFNKIEAWIK